MRVSPDGSAIELASGETVKQRKAAALVSGSQLAEICRVIKNIVQGNVEVRVPLPQSASKQLKLWYFCLLKQATFVAHCAVLYGRAPPVLRQRRFRAQSRAPFRGLLFCARRGRVDPKRLLAVFHGTAIFVSESQATFAAQSSQLAAVLSA